VVAWVVVDDQREGQDIESLPPALRYGEASQSTGEDVRGGEAGRGVVP
jgi:hypothetical protein